MQVSVVVFVFSTAVLVTAREAKWFLPHPTVTRYIYQQRMHTELVPSSCVVVEPTLKPCRNLRQLEPTSIFVPPKIRMTATPRMLNQRVSQPIRSSYEEPVRSWSSYLGLGEVTVTRTVTQLVTERSVTPEAVVTFSVRGCQPSRLPFDLPLCSIHNSTTAAGVTARILPTKDVHFVEEQHSHQ